MLNHTDPTIVGLDRMIHFSFADIVEFDLLEFVLFRINRRPRKGTDESRLAFRSFAVPEQLQIQGRIDRLMTQIRDFLVDIDDITAAFESICLGQANAILFGIHNEFDFIAILTKRSFTGTDMETGRMIRIQTTGQAGLCQIYSWGRRFKKNHILGGIDIIRILEQFQILENATVRIDLDLENVGRYRYQFDRLFFGFFFFGNCI